MWAMIAVSILMAIWACGLQIMQRRSAKNVIHSAPGALPEDFEKETVGGSAKV